LVKVNAKEPESRSVEHGPELPGGGRSGRSTSKKVVGPDASAGDGAAASSLAKSVGDMRRLRRGEATVAGTRQRRRTR
jgi:hypothetical protein